MELQRKEYNDSITLTATMKRVRRRQVNYRTDTYESEGSTLGLLLTTKLEAVEKIREYRQELSNDGTHCLQRLSVSCILYLHDVHSSLSTTFFVVFAYSIDHP